MSEDEEGFQSPPPRIQDWGDISRSPIRDKSKYASRSIIPDPIDEKYIPEDYNDVGERARSIRSRELRKQGMEHLYKIVGTRNLNRRIKRVKKAVTAEGAKDWIDKHKLKGYTVKAEDVDKDGIVDIIVEDDKGVPYVVNGYMLAPSDFAYRQYFANLDTKQRNGNKNYRDYFRNEYYNPTYNEVTGEIDGYEGKQPGIDDDFVTKAITRGFNSIRPRKLSTYQLFTKYVRELCNKIIESEGRFGLPLDVKVPATIFMKVAADMWIMGIIATVLQYKYGRKDAIYYLQKDPKAYPNIRKLPDFKNWCKELVNAVITDETQGDTPANYIRQGIFERLVRRIEDFKRILTLAQ